MKQLRGGFSLLELDVVDSTNEYLKRQGGQLPDKTVVMAHRQTAGKGRLGRSWQSEPGESLAVSWLFCSLEPQQLQWLPLAAGMALHQSLESQLGQQAGLFVKWPNDLVLEGRKLAGILTEASLSGRGVDYVVIGIGVNLRQRPDDFSPEVARIATSLEAQGYPADRAALETALAEALCQAFGHLHTPAVYAADYRRLCLNLGQTLRIPDTGETVTALDIDRQYGLVVRRRDGTVDTLRCGEVSVRGLYGYV